MTAQECWDGLLEDALLGLLSMTPDQIESAEQRIRERWEQAGPLELKALSNLKLAHAAAVQAAQLWRGSIPQAGYSPAGPTECDAVGSGLCVTG